MSGKTPRPDLPRPPHEHLWVDFDFPRPDGSVTQFCPRCGHKREKAAGGDAAGT